MAECVVLIMNRLRRAAIIISINLPHAPSEKRIEQAARDDSVLGDRVAKVKWILDAIARKPALVPLGILVHAGYHGQVANVSGS